jgi:hypothetical protein
VKTPVEANNGWDTSASCLKQKHWELHAILSVTWTLWRNACEKKAFHAELAFPLLFWSAGSHGSHNSIYHQLLISNSKAVADKHYIKPQTVLPDVRKAVDDALSGLIQ